MYSIVVPMYNEESVIYETHKRLTKVMQNLGENYEIIYINDGSIDKTSQIILDIAKTDSNVRMLDFSRNFGHQTAITAGIDYASGDAVIIIDSDLQDPPEIIPEMIDKWKEGFEVVYGKRKQRKGETFFKKITASLYYRLLKKLTDIELPVDTGDFRLIDKKVCSELKKIREKNRYVRGIVNWVGFSHTYVEYIREKRFAGITKYKLKKMLSFAMDGITSFSQKPLRLSTYAGIAFEFIFLMCFMSVLLGNTDIWIIILMIAMFTNGIVLIMIGLVGEYIGRIYEESKQRPLYILRDKVGFDIDEES